MASSISTVSNSGKNYLSGLVSNMDTESLVKSMLSGTQSKIDKQSGLKQQLSWKQEMYRSIITDINKFRDKYFSYTNSETNLLSSNLYKTMKGNSSSTAVTIGAVSNNAVSNMTIDKIEQLATSSVVKSHGTVTGNAVAGENAKFRQFDDGVDYSFNMTLDGVSRTISFKGGGADKDATLANINQAIKRNFGSAVEMKLGTGADSGKITLAIPDSSRRVTIGAVADEASTVENLGFGTGFTNKLDYGTALGNSNFAGGPLTGGSPTGDGFKFVINGVTIAGLTEDSTLSDVLSAINNSDAGVTISYSSTSDKFVMQSKATGEGADISMSDTSGNLLEVMFGSHSVAGVVKLGDTTAGQNAKLTVDGTEIERNTNAFELDGITIELTGKTDVPIDLTTSRDTDKIVDSLKSFVEDYNTLIEDLNSRIGEDASYKSYAPLTSEQKAEMTDREIELWEEKSKEGLLRNDSNIGEFLSSMRKALYSSVESAGISLYDIGIETSSNWRDNGKLVFTESELRETLATNADGIQKLFTDPDEGLAVKLEKALKDAANVSSGSPGTLVQYAGTKDVLATDNTIYREMKSISDVLTRLNASYEKEKSRYWKQFNAMEQALANLNSQSSWLSGQFTSS